MTAAPGAVDPSAPAGRFPVRTAATLGLTFVMLMANNGFILAGPTVFDGLIQAQLHIATAALRLRDTITVLTLGVSVPLVGLLLDRFPVRPILAGGLILGGGGLLAYGHVQTIGEIYAVHFVLGLAQATAGVVSCVYLVSGWTRVHRGAALGLLIAGSSLGNAAIPAFNAALLHGRTWREAIEVGGWASLALIPLVFLIVREPQRAQAGEAATGSQGGAMTLGAVVGDRSFWLLAAVAMTTVFGVLALATNLALFASQLPAGSSSTGPLLLFCLFGAAVTAQVLTGLTTYRIETRTIHRLAVLLMLVGALLFALAPPKQMLLPILLFGFGWGANSCMLQVRPSILFPPAVLGRALSLLAFAETLGGGLGPFIAGLAIDHLGGFRPAFLLVSFVLILPAGLGLFLGRRPSPLAREPGLA